MPLITLCMIVKNEETELPLVLESAKDFVDEIVIYDTGSKDDSVALARKLGAKVIEGYWDSDFSRARNASLDECSGEWILWLDADEAIHGNFDLTREILENVKDLDSFLIPIESVELHGMGTASVFHATRLFRKDKCHWSGPLHEQVLLRSTGEFPSAAFIPHLRILHRGYTAMKWKSKDLLNRNLTIAEKALDDPTVPKARALFDYGRTMTQGDDPKSAIPILEEAAATTDSPTIKRASYRVIFDVYIACNMYDQAEEVIEILRREYKTPYTVDSLHAKLLLQRGLYEDCIRIAEHIPYSVTDDDGVEIGHHNIAWIKAQAQNALGRPGEAADTLLNVLRQHGKLDENLRILVSYLYDAGRNIDEIVMATRRESVGVMSALASVLNIDDADQLLAKFLEIYPDKNEPLAAMVNRAGELPIVRQMWWSNELRKRGFAEQCPLVHTLSNIDADLLARMTAGAAAYLTFQDQRAAKKGKLLFSTVNERAQEEIIAAIGSISPEYLAVITSDSKAAHITVQPCSCKGYEHYIYKPDKEEEKSIFSTKRYFADNFSPSIPLSANSFHVIKLDYFLSTLSHMDAARAIKMFSGALTTEGRLIFEVGNLYSVIKYLENGEIYNARKAIYPYHRYLPTAKPLIQQDAWEEQELINFLSGSNLVIEKIETDQRLSLVVEKGKIGVISHGIEPPDVSIIFFLDARSQNADFISCINLLEQNGDLQTAEIVIVASDPPADLKNTIDILDGDIVKIDVSRSIDFSTAVDVGVQNSHGKHIVYIENGISLEKVRINNLTKHLGNDAVGLVSPVLVDKDNIIINAGYGIYRDEKSHLNIVDNKAYSDANKHLLSDFEVDAISHVCFAVARDKYDFLAPITPLLQPRDALIDLSLRAKSAGYINKIAENCFIEMKSHDYYIDHFQSSEYEEFFYPAEYSQDLLEMQWAASLEEKKKENTFITASSLLPNTTILERIQDVILIAPHPRDGGVNLIADFTLQTPWALSNILMESGLEVSKLNFTKDGITQLDQKEFLHYYINILYIPGYQLVDFVGNAGMNAMSSRYNILYWDWPIAKVRDDAQSEISMVHEVWVPSEFTYKSLKDISFRSISLLPLLSKYVLQSDIPAEKENDFIHITRMRKGYDCEVITDNTIMTIETFIEAFGDHDMPKLKIIFAGEENNKLLTECKNIAKEYKNISFDINSDNDLLKAEILKSNCYVSFHQAGAYNLDALIAVANGIPVIATAYGGINDLINSATAETIPYTLEALESDLFPLRVGDMVAKPDKSAALKALQKVYSNYADSERKAWLGRKNINSSHSTKQVIKNISAYIKRIDQYNTASKKINA